MQKQGGQFLPSHDSEDDVADLVNAESRNRGESGVVGSADRHRPYEPQYPRSTSAVAHASLLDLARSGAIRLAISDET